jgi:protein-S-isoprenylcysteine O-methyltransferase Ste14
MPMNNLELKVLPGLVAAACVAAMWFVSSQSPALAFIVPHKQLLALALAGIGLCIGFSGVLAFRKMKTTVNPIKPGSASCLVTSGIYRYTRNPMYLGLLLILAGCATQFANLLAFLLLPAFVAYMNRFQIEPEERALAAKFQDAFTAYKQSARRWL